MSEWLYRIVPARAGMPDAPTAEESEAVSAHFQYLVGLHEQGVVRLAGRTQDEATFGIVIFHAADEAAARALMEADPAVDRGVFIAELHPFATALPRLARSLAGSSGSDPARQSRAARELDLSGV